MKYDTKIQLQSDKLNNLHQIQKRKIKYPSMVDTRTRRPQALIVVGQTPEPSNLPILFANVLG